MTAVTALAGPFDLGDIVRLSLALVDGNNNPRDATAVTLAIKEPDGTIASAPVVRDGTGLYHSDYQPVDAGQYFYRFEGTGSATAAEEGSFIVRTRAVQ